MKINLSGIKKIAIKHQLKVLILFGSQLNEKTHPESDLDLSFYSDIKVDEEKLYSDLTHLFKRADIDLINLFTTHNHLLRFEILHNGKVLYEKKPGMKSTLEWQSYFDYQDFKKYYELRSQLLDHRLQEAAANG